MTQAMRLSARPYVGAVPIAWKDVRLKHVLKAAVTDGPHETPVFVDEGHPFLSVDGIQDGKLVFDGCRFIDTPSFDEYRKKAAPEVGDLLMGKAASTGKIARVTTPIEFAIWSPLALIKLNDKITDSRFIEYVLKTPSLQQQIDDLCNANTQKNIGMGDIPRLAFALPTKVEQERIANFLDDKTARIDALIAEKERLIERIAELRNSEFSNAITFGLRPGVKTCDTGHSALPKIPIGWKLSRLKWVCSLLRDGTHTPPPRVDVGMPLLSVRNVQNGEFTFLPDDSLISEADYLELNRSFHVQQGDVLLAVVGATMGKVAEVRDMGRPFQIQRSLAVMRPKANEIGATLLAAAIRSEYFQNMLWQNTGFSAQPGTYLGALADFPIPVPPLEEQKQIVAYLARKERDFDNLTEHTVEHLARLREYRSSLISAAVTGQLDVGTFKEAP